MVVMVQLHWKKFDLDSSIGFDLDGFGGVVATMFRQYYWMKLDLKLDFGFDEMTNGLEWIDYEEWKGDVEERFCRWKSLKWSLCFPKCVDRLEDWQLDHRIFQRDAKLLALKILVSVQ